MKYTGLYGLKAFMQAVLGLISQQANEPTREIIAMMEKRQVVDYIAQKYPISTLYQSHAGVYDTVRWEQAFYDRCHYRTKNELATKFNVFGDYDGLLLVLSFGMDYLTDLGG